MSITAQLAEWIWNPWLLGMFLITGIFFSFRSGFFQLFELRLWMKYTLGSFFKQEGGRDKRGVSPVQALATALGSTIGTGSIAGVATAIFFGGPGAVFWIWISAFLGMMIGYVEKTLAVLYRKKDASGRWIGGPMFYIAEGLGWKWAARFFAAVCVVSTLLGGNVVQANSIAGALEAEFGWSPLKTGIVVMVLTALIMAGGLRRIAEVSELLVPLMAVLFICGGLAVVICNIDMLPTVFGLIVKEAFRPASAVGGCGGYGMMTAMRYGVARGVFTNEAGVGSSAIAHASAVTDEPAQQGMWGLFEVFTATIVICTVTALAILSSGVYVQEEVLSALASGDLTGQLVGAPLSMAAFASVMGRWGSALVSICLLLFAFTSVLGWSYYGKQALRYLTENHVIYGLYYVVFLISILLGSVSGVEKIWQIADICTGLMALPNLLALWRLLPEAMNELRLWKKKRT